ncbi:MAG: DUF3343 domain-containing protein [Planctomycetes bacterium]|nr:DUF3343 domain-containing protein [Planctomycetota bacterium]
MIKAERLLKSKAYQVEARLTPRQLSHECGICLEVTSESDPGELKSLLEGHGLVYSRFEF